MSSTTSPVEMVLRKMKSYNAEDALASAGALHLMPENAGRAVRLNVLAHAAAALKPRGGQVLRPEHLRAAVAAPPLDSGSDASFSIASLEDPITDLFTEAFTFRQGSHTVFPGITEQATFRLQHLLRAVLLPTDANAFNADFQSSVDGLATGVLALSDAIARRAGLMRGIDPKSSGRDRIVVPDVKRLSRLQRAVTWSRSDWERLMAQHGLAPDALDSLCLAAGSVSSARDSLSEGELLRRPLVRVGNKMIVAMPGELLSALRTEILAQAAAKGLLSPLAREHHLSATEAIERAMRLLDIQQASIDLPSLSTPDDGAEMSCLSERIFEFDTDKILYVAFLSDNLTNYSPDQVDGRWDMESQTQVIEKRMQQVMEFLASLPAPPNEVMSLVVLQSAGRGGVMGFDGAPYNAPLLTLDVAGLETIAHLEMGDPLALWKFARASTRLRDRTKVVAWSTLDEFQLYRAGGHCYDAPGQQPISKVNFLNISPGGDGVLRSEVAHKRDFHGVITWDGRHSNEVMTLHNSSSIPIYVPLADARMRRIEQLVEGLPVPVWIVGPGFDNTEERALRTAYAGVASAISYWLWQLTPAINEVIQGLAELHRRLAFHLRLVPDDRWFDPDASPSSDPPVEFGCVPSEHVVRLTVRSSLVALCTRPDNHGEREMMRAVLQALRGLLPVSEQSKTSDERVQAMLDRFVPLGVRKMILPHMAVRAPELDPRDLPSYRHVQECDENELLIALGPALGQKGFKTGVVEAEHVGAVLNEAVTLLYSELEREVATLRPDGLLEFLTAQREAVQHHEALHRTGMVTRRACFGDVADIEAEIADEIPRNAQTAVANRFLLEYVAARPPRGLRPISLSVYDRLMAMAARICAFGLASDVHQYQLSEIVLEITESGSLSVDRKQFGEAVEAFMTDHVSASLLRATESFADSWRGTATISEALERDRVEASDEAAASTSSGSSARNSEHGADADQNRRIDDATRAEWGVSLTELAYLVGAAREMCFESSPVVACVPLNLLLERLEQKLEWPSDKVQAAVSLLCLKPRPNFLKPPKPFQKEDVYPWRYNRALSCLRRPLSIRTRLDEQRQPFEEVVWGPRHLFRSIFYIRNLILEGRLFAHSSEMRALLSHLNDRRGHGFNTIVAQVARQSGLPAPIEIKRVGPLELPKELGDIDVLVFNADTREISVVQCKDFSAAATPYEIHGEIEKLFRHRTAAGTVPEKLEKQAQWVRDHQAEVLTWAGLPANERWKVKPFIVVDHELLSPYLVSSPVPVLSLAQWKILYSSKH